MVVTVRGFRTYFAPSVSLIYPVSQKNRTLSFRQMLTEFHSSFTNELSSKFTIRRLLKIPPHLKRNLWNLSLEKLILISNIAIKKLIFLEQFNAVHSYRLPVEFPGKTGQGEG